MKLFLSFQLLIVTAAVIAGFIIRSSVPDAGIGSAARYEDIRQLDFDVITTAEAAGTKHFRAFNDGGTWLYDNSYSAVVFVCRACDSYKCVNGVFSQKVTVEKQISGICPEAGETVELTVKGGACRYPKEMYFYNEFLPEDMSGKTMLTILNLEGMNFMRPGRSYLIACQTRTLGGIRYYGSPYGEACWLCLDENSDLLLTEPYEKADYSKYADNEFFCRDKATLRSLLIFKEQIFSRYGLDIKQ